MKFNNLPKEDFKVKYKISQEEIEKNPKKVKENFIKNISENQELRKELWIKLYWDIKNKAKYRNNKQRMINDAENQFISMNQKEKEDWYDFVIKDDNTLGFIGELNFIAQSLKGNKGNVKKVWQELKTYGEIKNQQKEK